MKNQETLVNFSSICNDALELFSNAFNKVVLLAQEEKWGTNIEEEVYFKAESECGSAILSCLGEEDQRSANIYDFDIEAFLSKIGVISGELQFAKKSHRKKVRCFIDHIKLTKIWRNPIDMLLLIIEAFDETKCFNINRNNGTITRKFDDKDKISKNIISYTPYPMDLRAKKSIHKSYGSILKPFQGGGVNPR